MKISRKVKERVCRAVLFCLRIIGFNTYNSRLYDLIRQRVWNYTHVEWFRDYYASHKEEIKANYLENRAEENAKDKANYWEHRDEFSKRWVKYYALNKDEINAKKREKRRLKREENERKISTK